MGLGDYSDGEARVAAEFQEYLPHGPIYTPHADDAERDISQVEEEEKQAVDVASYFRRYRAMEIFGFMWTNAEYDWLEERLTGYNI